MPNFEYEDKHYAEGYTAVCGCDEAGRGPLCGPVVAAAVILPRDVEIEGLNDSKKLTEDETEGLDSYDLFELVGRKRGFLISGGEINHQRTAEMLLEEFRSAKIGRISLEKPM